MKINNKKMSYEEVLKLPRLQHKKPLKPQMWLATIVRIVCEETLRKIKFSYTTERMELVGDQPIEYMLKENKSSVLMYPEAGYSFDGCATTLPRKLGVLMKRLGVPVVTVIT